MFPRFWGSASPDALETERVVPNTIIDIPAGTHSVDLTCDWAKASSANMSDVDLSAVLFGPGDREVDWVDIKKRHVPGVRHGGDGNSGGLVVGKRETVVVTFPEVPAAVKDVYVCAVSSAGKQAAAALPELCMWLKAPQVDRLFKVASNPASGYLFGRFRKVGADHWQFETLGTTKPDCVKWQDLQSEIKKAAGFAFPEPKPIPAPKPAPTAPPPEAAPPAPKPAPPQLPQVAFKEETLGLPDNCRSIHVGCKSDPAVPIDLDLSAIMFGAGDNEIGKVDYKTKAAPGMTHSGDDYTSQASGDDESICIDLGAVPAEAQAIFFCVTVFTEGVTFDKIKDLCCHLVWPGLDKSYPVATAGKNGFVFGKLGRDGDQWSFQTFGASRGDCITWFDLRDEMRKLRSTPQPSVVPKPREVFLEETLDVPGGCNKLHVGCGWDSHSGKDVDIDISAIMFDAGDGEIAIVDFKEKAAPGMHHSGDDLTGTASGDDESITIDLGALPADAREIFFCITVFTEGLTFEQIKNLRCHLVWPGVDKSYPVEAAGKNGLVFGRLGKDGDKWSFQTFGASRGGCLTWRDLKDVMRMLRSTYPVVPLRRVWHPVEHKVPGDVDVVDVGYAWDDDAGKVDVDLSTLMFAGSGADPVQVVDFKTKSCKGAVHSGDTRHGVASGDDEVVKVTLSEVPPDVTRIVFTATIFTPDTFFDMLGDTYFSLYLGGREVGKYFVTAPGRKNGYIFGELQRNPDGWAFVSVNVSKEGCISWADLKGDISLARCGGKRATDADDSVTSKRRKSLEGGFAFATITN